MHLGGTFSPTLHFKMVVWRLPTLFDHTKPTLSLSRNAACEDKSLQGIDESPSDCLQTCIHGMAFFNLLSALATSAFIALVLYQSMLAVRFRLKYKFPHPVPGLPLVGNILQIPKQDQRQYFTKLAKEHGEMYLRPLTTVAQAS